MIVVADLAVEVSQIGSVADGSFLLDELEEEGVFGALEADRTQGRKTKKKLRESKNKMNHGEL